MNTFHQLGMALGLAILVAVSAGARDATEQFSHALIGSTALLALALLVVLAVVVPAHRAAHRIVS